MNAIGQGLLRGAIGTGIGLTIGGLAMAPFDYHAPSKAFMSDSLITGGIATVAGSLGVMTSSARCGSKNLIIAGGMMATLGVASLVAGIATQD